MEAYETIGELFEGSKQNYIENKLNNRILAVFTLIITLLGDLIDSIDTEIITQNIMANIEKFGVLLNIHSFQYQSDT